MKQTDPQIKVRLEPEVKTWVEDKAKADERSQTWLINHLVKEAMRREQQPTR
ncbi:hypothetical protein PRZ61_03055 [Halomonas pacifica]|uniref:hypothetical protein n=1 Tax=Bisbaumannia pacifica TaxID=77098 RepID=UPI002359CF3D|nr:hypothetical protein [Halomonas pacifica]MDC8802433.1 hypothetical protein [Halomonas pacifica]